MIMSLPISEVSTLFLLYIILLWFYCIVSHYVSFYNQPNTNPLSLLQSNRIKKNVGIP